MLVTAFYSQCSNLNEFGVVCSLRAVHQRLSLFIASTGTL